MNYKEIIKEQLVQVLKKDFPHIKNVESLVEVKECKDLSKGNYSVSLHAFVNAINKK